jgi:hypothetical protein
VLAQLTVLVIHFFNTKARRTTKITKKRESVSFFFVVLGVLVLKKQMTVDVDFAQGRLAITWS